MTDTPRDAQEATDREHTRLLSRVYGALAPEGCPAYGEQRGFCDPLTCDCSMGDFDTEDQFIEWCAALRIDAERYLTFRGRATLTRNEDDEVTVYTNAQQDETTEAVCRATANGCTGDCALIDEFVDSLSPVTPSPLPPGSEGPND